MTPNYSAILDRKFSNFKWTLNGDDYSGLTWLSDTPMPTKEELDNLWYEVKSEIANEIKAKVNAKNDLLNRLGITVEELKLLLGNDATLGLNTMEDK